MKPHLLQGLCLTCLIPGTLLAASVDTAGTPTTEPVQELESIAVSGLKDPAFLSYAKIMKALAAFNAYHAHAPTAQPRFKLVRKLDKDDPGGAALALSLADDTRSIDIQLASDLSFALPRAPQVVSQNAELVLNRSRDLYGIFPDIRSSGVPVNSRRLGDLRLECEMIWSVLKEDQGTLLKITLGALGGACHTGLASFGFRAPQRLSGATLVSGNRREPLPTKKILANGLGFSPPLHDQSWPDDTLVEFRFTSSEAGE